MSQIVMLDAAFPPRPDQWVADLRACGAAAGAIYTFGGFLHYTAEHVALARSLGLDVLPIVVPGNQPPPVASVLDTVKAYGLNLGPIACDLENGSLPPDAWVRAFIDLAHSEGYGPVLEYGTPFTLALYSSGVADGYWVANWGNGSVPLRPFPDLAIVTFGSRAWQYTHNVMVNGSQYDASVIDAGVFDSVGLTIDEHQKLDEIWNFLYYGGDGRVPGESVLLTKLNELLKRPALDDPGILAPILAREIAQHLPQDQANLVAAAVVTKIAAQFAKP